MATILIRNVPEMVLTELVGQSARSRRSTEKHALFLIENGLRIRRPIKETLARAHKLRGEFKRPVQMNEILKWTEEEH